MKRITVRVPATIANLGPGFDALGLAVTIHNELISSCDEPRAGTPADVERRLADIRPEIQVEGEGAGEIAHGRDNLIFRAASDVFRLAGRAPTKLGLHSHNEIPFQRGLGSSAAAAAAGAVAANIACGGPLDAAALLNVVAAIEGHPDNGAPALLGGFTVCLKTDDGFRALRFPVPDAYRIVLCIPEARVSTAAARAALPAQVSREDAVFCLSRAAVLVGLLTRGVREDLREAMRDRLHQPQRLALVPGLADALEAALAAGALGAVVSGSGPALAAFVAAGDAEAAEAAGQAMVNALASRGAASRHRLAAIEGEGALSLA